jgi:hypothetical protein
MRTKLGIGLLIVLALAIVTLPAASASSPARSGDGDDEVEVIRVVAMTAQEADLDLGEEGDSLGDEFVFSDDLFRHGERVGIDGGTCTLVRLEPMVSATLQCLVTAELPKGQITAQGLITFSEETEGEPFRLAITGGTERYKDAHGQVRVVEVSETEARLTFQIIH